MTLRVARAIGGSIETWGFDGHSLVAMDVQELSTRAVLTLLIILAFAMFLPGYGWWRRKRSALPIWVAAVGLSTVLTSSVGLALAAAGVFTVSRLLAINALVALAGYLIVGRSKELGAETTASHADSPPNKRNFDLGRFEPYFGPVILICSLLLYWPPYETHVAGSDSTAYISAGMNLVESEKLSKTDELMGELSFDLRRGLFFSTLGHSWKPPYVRQPGGVSIMTHLDTEAYPNFFPTPMVWSALSYAAAGTRYAGAYAGLFSALAVLACWLFARRHIDVYSSTIAAALIAANLACYWSGRFALSEPLAWFLVWLGLTALSAIGPETDDESPERRLNGILAGIFLGAAGLVRVEYVFFISTILPLRWLLRRQLRVAPLPHEFYVAYISMIAVTLVETRLLPGGYAVPITDAWQGLLYTIETMWTSRPTWLVLGALGGVAITALGFYYAGWRETVALGVFLGFVAGYTGFASSLHFARSLSWVEYALGWPTFGFAIFGGVGLWIGQAPTARNGFFVLLLTTVTLLLLYDPHVHADYLWGLRRFVPLVVPGLIISAAIGAALIFYLLMPAGVLAWCLLILVVAWPAHGLWKRGIYRGSHDQLIAFNQTIPEDGAFFIDLRLASYVLGTSLWLGKDRYCVPVNTVKPDKRELVAQAATALIDKKPIYLVVPGTNPAAAIPGYQQRRVGTFTFETKFPLKETNTSKKGLKPFRYVPKPFKMAVTVFQLKPT